MLRCRDVVARASDYVEGEMSGSQRIRFRFHLLMCVHCRRFMANLRTLVALLRGRRDAAPVSDQVLSRIQQQLAARLNAATANPVVTLPTRGRSPDNKKQVARVGDVQSPSNAAVQGIFQEIESVLGHVPSLFRTYAHNPAVLAANWNKVKTIMLQGSLSRKLKESIAMVVSEDNGCHYCVAHHRRALMSLGVEPVEIERICRDPLTGHFEPKERALLALARQANNDPHGASDQQVQVARQAGASDADIIEALAVMEIYTAANKFLDVLAIPLEVAT